MILANCGTMGLSWERLSLSAYFEALQAYGDMHSTDDGPGEVQNPDRLRRVLKARANG